MAKKNICKRQGYHNWGTPDADGADSVEESYEGMTLEATCKDCEATWQATGDWEDLPGED